jgi:gamma-glutamyltranspeptidase
MAATVKATVAVEAALAVAEPVIAGPGSDWAATGRGEAKPDDRREDSPNVATPAAAVMCQMSHGPQWEPDSRQERGTAAA